MGNNDQTTNPYFDTFAQLMGGYFGMRTAEAQADATGAAQANLTTAVEKPSGNSQVPVNPTQYQAVGAQAATNTTGKMPFGLSQNQLLMGVGLIAALFFLKK